MLRGIVMAVMAVDHLRDFVSPTPFDPTCLGLTTPGFFLTRWVPHFCAPVFVLLPRVGVLFVGWSLARVLRLSVARRGSICRRLGLGLMACLVILRASNLYGDPSSREQQQKGGFFKLFSFVNCTKYQALLLCRPHRNDQPDWSLSVLLVLAL